MTHLRKVSNGHLRKVASGHLGRATDWPIPAGDVLIDWSGGIGFTIVGQGIVGDVGPATLVAVSDPSYHVWEAADVWTGTFTDNLGAAPASMRVQMRITVDRPDKTTANTWTEIWFIMTVVHPSIIRTYNVVFKRAWPLTWEGPYAFLYQAPATHNHTIADVTATDA